MPAPTATIDGFVLAKRPPSESFQTLTVFALEQGTTRLLQRVPRKLTPAFTPLDLFDEIAATAEAGTHDTWFLREARIVARHAEIGRHYRCLQAASDFARLITRHPVPDESRAAVHALIRTALGAFARTERPDIVYFKSVYCLARDEGYPLKQQWWPTLPAADREDVVRLVAQPVADATLDRERVAYLQRRLEEYLQGHTEWRFA